MFDTHCHLNFQAFDGRVDQVVAAAVSVGVTNIVVPGTDIESSVKAVEIAQQFDNIYAAVGIHPHHVFERLRSHVIPSEIEGSSPKGAPLDSSVVALRQLLQNDREGKIIAVGEIGLDRHIYEKTKYGDYGMNEEFMELQKEYFVTQLKLAVEFEKAVVIHCREAKEDLLRVIEESWGDWRDHLSGHTVFHCCEPEPELLEFARAHNIFIGVDGDLTYPHNQAKQNFVKSVPLEMLVLETDSPYLAPAVDGVKMKFPNSPANLPLIADFVARLKGIDIEEVEKVTTENAQKLFNL